MRLARLALLVLGLVGLAAGAVALVGPRARPAAGTPTSAAPGAAARVVGIVDGDTIDVEIGGETYRLRYIGVNTPERDQPLYREAKEANRALVMGREVRLVRDVSETDGYGRLLRYVWVGDTFVNGELVRRGFAQASTYPPDVARQAELGALQREAIAERRGMWAGAGPTVPPAERAPGGAGAGAIAVDAGCSQFDAPGNDNQALESEWVCIANRGAGPIDLTGWVLQDAGVAAFIFPQFGLESGARVRVRTGCGADGVEDLYWCHEGRSAVWNNGGDSVRLFDAAGNLAASYDY